METTPINTPRAALFVPADRPDRHSRAFAAGADAVIVDLEDAVLPEGKAGARAALAADSPRRDGSSLLLLRVNSPLLPEGREDLAAAVAIGPDAIVVPKADSESVELAAAAGLPLVALVETAAGVLDAARTAAHPAVAMLMLGPVDLLSELGLVESHGGDELLLARQQVVIAAAAAGLSGPLDGPCLRLRDEAALGLEIERSKRAGFGGKSCIHPSQVAPVTAAFSPGAEDLEWARGVLEAFEAAAGGVAVIDGQMIDKPVVQRARRILSNDERGG